MPRLGLDCLFLDPGVTGGPETFLRELVPEIAEAAPRGWDIEVATSRRGAVALDEAGWSSFARLFRLRTDDDERLRKLLAQQIALPRLARDRGWSVLHSL